MINFVFSMAHIYPPGAPKGLLWLHLEKWAFLSYQHNAELSTVNVDHFGSLEGTERVVLMLYTMKGLKEQFVATLSTRLTM